MDSGTLARWVAGDDVYGDNPHLRSALEANPIGYVLAVSSTHQVATPAGRFQAKALFTRLPKRAWQRLSAGAGSKGERYCDWAQVDITGPDGRFGNWWLLPAAIGEPAKSRPKQPVGRYVQPIPSWLGCANTRRGA
ncbi:hypothetical protein [Streptomyces sp. NPDC056549]|uniref:hypothetical protein n=1 Tax=Streptomyces sp. NPDC056549 TaxID=3345864 RepID=UPI0036CCA38D